MDERKKQFFMEFFKIHDPKLGSIVRELPDLEVDLFTAQFSDKNKMQVMDLLSQASNEKDNIKRTKILQEISVICKQNYAPDSTLGKLARKLNIK